jgi:hypothetical protein
LLGALTDASPPSVRIISLGLFGPITGAARRSLHEMVPRTVSLRPDSTATYFPAMRRDSASSGTGNGKAEPTSPWSRGPIGTSSGEKEMSSSGAQQKKSPCRRRNEAGRRMTGPIWRACWPAQETASLAMPMAPAVQRRIQVFVALTARQTWTLRRRRHWDGSWGCDSSVRSRLAIGGFGYRTAKRRRTSSYRELGG